MDSPRSDDERLHQADAGQDVLSKKMKLLIIMLSLVLIILLLPLASNHGLPLLKPMGVSMLQRLWDAMRFIAMTAAISVGIISTSSQRNDKGSDRSAHLRSHRSSTPIASSSGEFINPNMIYSSDMNRSSSPNPSVGRDVFDILQQRSTGAKDMGNSRSKSKGKELMDDFSTVPSSSDAFPYASREGGIYGSGSSSNHVHSQRAPSQEENYENLKQRPTNSRRRLSASDAWFPASRIDEEIEEEGNIASALPGPSPGKSLGGSQKKSFPIDDKGHLSNKEIKSADRGFKNVYANMADDNYAELRMRKAAILRLADETHEANGNGHRRSSSVDRRRPIHYDDQGPDRPGLKQILMDVSKERAFNGKLSNLSSANKKMLNVNEQSEHPQSVHASISSTPNAVSTLSSGPSMKASIQHHPTTGTLSSDSSEIARNSESGSIFGSNQVVGHKQQEAINMGANQILQKHVDQTPNQIRQKQDDALKGHNQRIQANMRSNQIVKRRDDYQAKVDTVQSRQKQDDLQAKVGFKQTLQKQADAKMAFSQTLPKADARMGSHPSISQMQLHGDAKARSNNVSEVVQMQHQHNDAKGSACVVQRRDADDQRQEDFQSTLHRPKTSSRSKSLLQSSKHSRSDLNLEQLEQKANTVHARPPTSSSVKRKKSFSCDFGDGFNPDWLWELEPPPPPGFIDHQSVMTSPNTKAGQSVYLATPRPESNNESSATLVQSLVPWRSSVPINISAYPRAASPVSPPDAFPHSTGPSPGEVNRRADEFISNFTTKLIRQRQESLERQRRNG